MSVGQWLLRVAAVSVLLSAGLLLTPDFVINPPCGDQVLTSLTCTGDDYVIPDIFWLPMVALVNLNEYFPFATIITLALLTLAIRVSFVGWWLASWVWSKVAP